MLADLRRDFPQSQVIVVDGGSVDDSAPAALRGADVLLIAEAGRARQMNLGAEAATGQWLCFLHADTRPCFDENTFAHALDADAGWGFCNVHLRGKAWALALIARAINIRSRLTRVATGDQMLFVERQLFEQVRGFAAIPLMEDVELTKRLRRHGAPLGSSLKVMSSGRRWDVQGVLRTIVRMWGLRFAYWCGVSPERLWRHYYGAAALPAVQNPEKAGSRARSS